MNTDRIERNVLLRAPLTRVWRALSDSSEFGIWFGIQFDGPFAPGATLRGTIVGTKVNAEVAKAQKEHEGLPFEIKVEQVEPERRLSFRWHPHAIERGVDYSSEPTPLARRAQAFAANGQGWGMVIKLIEDYLVQAP